MRSSSLKTHGVAAAILALSFVILMGCGKGTPLTRVQRAQKMMKSKDLAEQAKGIELMGSSGPDGEPAIPAILKLLSSESPAIRAAAVKALIRLDAKQAADKFVELAASENEAQVLNVLLDAIKVMKGPEVLVTVCKPLLAGNEAAIREATSAISFLDKGDPIPVAELLTLETSSDPIVRANIAMALRKASDANAKAALKRLAKDKNASVKAAALGGL